MYDSEKADSLVSTDTFIDKTIGRYLISTYNVKRPERIRRNYLKTLDSGKNRIVKKFFNLEDSLTYMIDIWTPDTFISIRYEDDMLLDSMIEFYKNKNLYQTISTKTKSKTTVKRGLFKIKWFGTINEITFLAKYNKISKYKYYYHYDHKEKKWYCLHKEKYKHPRRLSKYVDIQYYPSGAIAKKKNFRMKVITINKNEKIELIWEKVDNQYRLINKTFYKYS